MQTIYKYEIEVDGTCEVVMPVGAKVLSLAVQYDRPVMWAKVDTEAPTEVRRFRVRGTGHPLNGNEGQFVGTFQLVGGAFVGHVFEAAR